MENNYVKVILKRRVFKHDLKMATDGLSLISRGRSFHNLKAATDKALSPQVFKRTLGSSKRYFPADVKLLGRL